MNETEYLRSKRRGKFNKKKDSNQEELVNEIKYNVRIYKYSNALILSEEYLKMYPSDDYMKIFQCIILGKLYQNDEAEKRLLEILENEDLSKENRVFALLKYANILSHGKRNEEAKELFENAIEMSDKLELIARSDLSRLYRREKEYDKAIRILEIDGYNDDFLNTKRAVVYFEQGDYKSVFRELRRPSINKYNIFVYEKLDEKYIEQDKNYLLGHLFLKKGNLDTALVYLNKCTSMNNKNIYFKANVDIAKIYILKNRVDDAIVLCQELVNQTNSSYNTKIVKEILAKAYAKKNNYKKALETYSDESFEETHRKIRYGFLELLRGNFEKAEEYLSIINLDKVDVNECYNDLYRLALVKFRLGKYDEVFPILDIFDKYGTAVEVKDMKYELDRIRLIIDTKLGNKIEDREYSYSEKQIISYSKEDAINHIKEHHLSDDCVSNFNDENQLLQLFEYVKEKLTKDNIIYDGSFDKYMVRINNVGFSKNDNTINQLAVLTIPGTKDIITMYPTEGNESELIIEEPEVKTEEKKVKRLSQIEKFNKKYGNN